MIKAGKPFQRKVYAYNNSIRQKDTECVSHMVYNLGPSENLDKPFFCMVHAYSNNIHPKDIRYEFHRVDNFRRPHLQKM